MLYLQKHTDQLGCRNKPTYVCVISYQPATHSLLINYIIANFERSSLAGISFHCEHTGTRPVLVPIAAQRQAASVLHWPLRPSEVEFGCTLERYVHLVHAYHFTLNLCFDLAGIWRLHVSAM